MSSARTRNGTVILVAFRGVALFVFGQSAFAQLTTHFEPNWLSLLYATLFAALLWWGGGWLVHLTTPQTLPAGQVVPLARLREMFPGFAVTEGEFVERDGKLFRVNSTGMQVQVNDETPWSFQSGTGEYLRLSQTKSAGHQMVSTQSFAQRLNDYQMSKYQAQRNLFLAACLAVFFAAVLAGVGLFLASYNYVVGALLSFALLAGWVALLSVGFRRDIKLRTWSDEYILGPQPLTRRPDNFGASSATASSERSSETDYPMPI